MDLKESSTTEEIKSVRFVLCQGWQMENQVRYLRELIGQYCPSLASRLSFEGYVDNRLSVVYFSFSLWNVETLLLCSAAHVFPRDCFRGCWEYEDWHHFFLCLSITLHKEMEARFNGDIVTYYIGKTVYFHKCSLRYLCEWKACIFEVRRGKISFWIGTSSSSLVKWCIGDLESFGMCKDGRREEERLNGFSFRRLPMMRCSKTHCVVQRWK